jgi:hypothetical protein
VKDKHLCLNCGRPQDDYLHGPPRSGAYDVDPRFEQHDFDAGERRKAKRRVGDRDRRDERSRGQALVEVALTLPFLLFILLGVPAMGILMIADYQVQHAATQGAIFGSSVPDDLTRCDKAEQAALDVLAHDATVTCTTTSLEIEITVKRSIPLLVPLFTDHVDVSATSRALIPCPGGGC